MVLNSPSFCLILVASLLNSIWFSTTLTEQRSNWYISLILDVHSCRISESMTWRYHWHDSCTVLFMKIVSGMSLPLSFRGQLRCRQDSSYDTYSTSTHVPYPCIQELYSYVQMQPNVHPLFTRNGSGEGTRRNPFEWQTCSPRHVATWNNKRQAE